MWGLIILAASAFLKHQAQQEAADRREQLRQAMESYQRSKAREAEGATEALVAKQTPEERGQELNKITADREQSLRDSVGAAQAFEAPQIAGKLSDDYRAVEEANAARIAERTRRAIAQLATIGAPAEQEREFGMRFGRAAGEVDAANRAGENVGRGYLEDINRVVPDPMTSMIADIGMSVGGGMIGGGMGASAAAMGADAGGNFSYEDSAGNLQQSAIPYRNRLNRGFSLWGL